MNLGKVMRVGLVGEMGKKQDWHVTRVGGESNLKISSRATLETRSEQALEPSARRSRKGRKEASNKKTGARGPKQNGGQEGAGG